MAAHGHLKNEFTEDEKYHNLMRWLNNVNKKILQGTTIFRYLQPVVNSHFLKTK